MYLMGSVVQMGLPQRRKKKKIIYSMIFSSKFFPTSYKAWQHFANLLSWLWSQILRHTHTHKNSLYCSQAWEKDSVADILEEFDILTEIRIRLYIPYERAVWEMASWAHMKKQLFTIWQKLGLHNHQTGKWYENNLPANQVYQRKCLSLLWLLPH